MTEEEKEQNVRVSNLAREISLVMWLYIAAHGKSWETFQEVLLALHLVHVNLQGGPDAKSSKPPVE